MFGSRSLRCSEYERPLVLLIALAVMLLAGAGAQADSPRSVQDGLQRDLGALRVQLDQVEVLPLEDHHAVALGTDIGDGSPAFRRQTLSTILRSAHRRLDRLGADARQAQADSHLAQLDRLRLGLLELQVRFDRLTGASDAAQAAKARAAAVALLEELVQSVARLAPAGRCRPGRQGAGTRHLTAGAGLVRGGRVPVSAGRLRQASARPGGQWSGSDRWFPSD